MMCDMEGIVNLEEFVSETMRQIIAGVKKAQAGEDGANVNASFPDTLGSNLSFNPAYGTFSRVDFDVALTAEQSGQAGGSLKVWGLASAEAGGKTSAQTVSRVVFAVPLRLPDGDQSKRLAAEAANEAERRRIDAIRNQPREGFV